MNELVPMNLQETLSLGDVLAKSGFFSDAKQASQAVVKVLAGRELGFGPIASMTGIHIVQGKPTVGANLMGAAIKGSGRYNYRVVHLDDQRAEIAFFENGNEVGRSAFTMDDAKRAGLTGNQTWTKYPKNMLFARAISNGARWYCPDVFSGVTPYTPDELGAHVEMDESGDIIDVTPTPFTDEPPLKPRQPEPSPAPDPADDNGINSPKALLAAANEATMGYYNAIPHMLHAIRKTTGDEHWNWPVGDTGAYLEAYQILVDYAKAQKESAS